MLCLAIEAKHCTLLRTNIENINSHQETKHHNIAAFQLVSMASLFDEQQAFCCSN